MVQRSFCRQHRDLALVALMLSLVIGFVVVVLAPHRCGNEAVALHHARRHRRRSSRAATKDGSAARLGQLIALAGRRSVPC
jgi:hypothetical protein